MKQERIIYSVWGSGAIVLLGMILLLFPLLNILDLTFVYRLFLGVFSIISLIQFVIQYKDKEWFKDYIEKVIENFDVREAINDMREETNIDLPEKLKEHYMNFFGQRFIELKQAYQKVYIEKTSDIKENERSY